MHSSTELRLRNSFIYNIQDRGGEVKSYPDGKTAILFHTPQQYGEYVDDQVELMNMAFNKEVEEE